MAILDTIFNSPLRLQIADFLSFQIFTGFDIWMIVHFIFGFVIMLFLVKIFKDKDKNFLLVVLFSILVIFEFYELFNFVTTNRFFIPETVANQMIDLIVGGLGAITYLFFSRNS